MTRHELFWNIWRITLTGIEIFFKLLLERSKKGA